MTIGHNDQEERSVPEITIVTSGLGFPEGPVALADGSVVLTEINGGRITRVAADGSKTPLGAPGGGPNGLAIGPDGALYLCNNGGNRYVTGHSMGVGPAPDYQGGSIQRVDLQTGERTTLYTQVDGEKLSAPNDIVFDRQGGFYFTDLGKRYPRHRDHGGLYYARPDGTSVKAIAYPILSANGVGLSPDERTVYVADTEGARLWAFDVAAPGELEPGARFAPHGGRCIAGLPGRARFDSLAVLASGNVAVATLTTGFITVLSPEGGVIKEVKLPDTYPTNICFGGSDMRTAWITLSDSGQHLERARAAPQLPAMSWAALPDIVLHADLSGSGAGVVLLHELGGSLESFDDVAESLAREFRVLRYDQRGAGRSEKPRARFGIADHVADLDALLRWSGLPMPVLLVGIAAACAILAEFALVYPERVSGLLMCGPVASTTPESAAHLEARADRAVREGMRAIASIRASSGPIRICCAMIGSASSVIAPGCLAPPGRLRL